MLTGEQSESVNIRKNTLLSAIKSLGVERANFTGYLEVKLDSIADNDQSEIWHLFFSRGKVVFSGDKFICFSNIFSALKSYLPSLRNNQFISSEVIERISQQVNSEPDISMVGVLGKLILNIKGLDYQKITVAINNHIVEDAEKHLFRNAKEVKIFSNSNVNNLRPIVGLDIEKFLYKIVIRRKQWKKNVATIPSLEYHVQCNLESPQWQNLSPEEKTKIQNLTSYGNTLAEIRYKLGEDSLKIAQIFGKLVEQKLVLIGAERTDLPAKVGSLGTQDTFKPVKPQVVIIDDSPVLLKQLSSVVKALGYEVKCCDDALKAVDILLECEPRTIFVDINMPKLSGFQLIKQIRSQPKLASIPLVILTAEKTMMNQQRAKWSKSTFLSKPLTSDDKGRFISELQAILHSLAPINRS